jgi:hypothetical protein
VVRSSFPAQRRLSMSSSRSVTHAPFDLDEAGYRINLSPSTRRPDTRAPNCRAPHGSGGLERQGSNLGLRRVSSHLSSAPAVCFFSTDANGLRARASNCRVLPPPGLPFRLQSEEQRLCGAYPSRSCLKPQAPKYWYILVHTGTYYLSLCVPPTRPARVKSKTSLSCRAPPSAAAR